jgi:hypothetical protein
MIKKLINQPCAAKWEREEEKIKSWTMREAWTVVCMRDEKYMYYFGRKTRKNMAELGVNG